MGVATTLKTRGTKRIILKIIMITEIPIFKKGTYDKPCKLFSDIKIGAVDCVGHSKIASIKKCKYCFSYKKDNSYYLEVLKENTQIVSEVVCNRPGSQLTIF